jgi:hypothetical protein
MEKNVQKIDELVDALRDMLKEADSVNVSIDYANGDYKLSTKKPMTYGIREKDSDIILSAIVAESGDELTRKICLAVKEEWSYAKVEHNGTTTAHGMEFLCFDDEGGEDIRNIFAEPFAVYF